MTNLILCGFKGCGKTHFGMRLAQRSLRPFIDTDERLETLHAEENGEKKRCREIYIASGELFFRNLEKQVILSLEGTTRSVIALGGGAILAQENVEIFKRLGTLVYLKAEKAVLKERIAALPRPAFLGEQSFEKMFEEREPIYAKSACMTLDLHGKEESQILSELEEMLGGK